MLALTTVDEARLFVLGLLGQASPRKLQLALKDQFIGVGQITWLGLCHDTNASFYRDAITLRRGFGVKGDKRSGSSPASWLADKLFTFFLPRTTSVNVRQVTWVADEDDEFFEWDGGEYPGQIVTAGAQGENIRTCGLDLAKVPFGSSLFFVSPAGELSPASLFVTGSRSNVLTLMVRSSGNRGNEIGVGWFVAAFTDEL